MVISLKPNKSGQERVFNELAQGNPQALQNIIPKTLTPNISPFKGTTNVNIAPSGVKASSGKIYGQTQTGGSGSSTSSSKITMADVKKSEQVGEQLKTSEKNQANIQKRTASYTGRFELGKGKKVEDENYTTTEYTPPAPGQIAWQKNVTKGYNIPSMNISAVSEQQQKTESAATNLELQLAMAGGLTKNETSSLGKSVFEPVTKEIELLSYSQALPPLAKGAAEGVIGVGRSIELLTTKPEIYKGTINLIGSGMLPAAAGIYAIGVANLAVTKPVEFTGSMIASSLVFAGISSFVIESPKVSTTIQIGEVAYGEKFGMAKSGIITKVGDKLYGTSAMTAFTIPEEGISKGVSLLKTTEGVKTPQYRFGASIVKSLGEQKGFDISFAAAKTIETTPELIPFGEPSSAIGAFKSKPVGDLFVSKGITRSEHGNIITSKSMKDTSLSIMRNWQPHVEKISAERPVTSLKPSEQLFQPHVQAVAKSIETGFVEKPTPSIGMIKPSLTSQLSVQKTEKNIISASHIKTSLKTETKTEKKIAIMQRSMTFQQGRTQTPLSLNIQAALPRQAQKQTQEQKQIQRQMQKQNTKQMMIQMPMPFSRPNTKMNRFIALPLLMRGEKRRKDLLAFTPSKRRYHYAPGFIERTMDLHGKVPRAILESRQSAVGFRPIPMFTRRKKVRKKR